MPRINRIRIINFSYNNDSRHILDETFNFHGGENALLNLANGGGKSVLVQLFMQPVVPGVTIQGRRIASFFRKKKLPAYIMIEWKLDGAGGYLLTGIGIVSAEAPGAEDEKSRIRYFTFTAKYTGANTFDIAHIPFVNRKGGVLEVLPFREAREMISEKARKDPLAFGYFPEDDGDRYGKHLAEFGIAQDEWRNVIAKINDSEGGLEEIFQKCRNSSQLLNDWIIKTVEKAMFRNRSEARRLEEMLESLVREVVENERFIIEKQLLDSFLGTFREQVEALAGLVQGLEGQKKLAGQLAALHGYLAAEKRALEGKYEENGLEMEACRAEEQRVELEERSNDYWLRHSEYEEARKKLETAGNSRRETEDALQEARLREKIMQAARLAGEISRIRSELSGLAERLSAARKQYDSDGRVRSLEYSLKIKLEEKLASLAAVLARLNGEKREKERLAGQAGEELRNIEGKRNKLEQEKGRLEERKSSFERYAGEVQRKLGLSLRRNLLGELDAAEIEKTGAALENTRAELTEKIRRLEGERTAAASCLQGIDSEVKALLCEQADGKAALSGLERDISEYEQREQEIMGILNKYGYDPALRFDRERLSALFGQHVKNLEDRLEEAARVRNDAAESLASLKNGRLHTPEELASLLAGLDIPYETGEAYLRGLPPENRRAMLGGNPVLPYAFIMARADLDRVADALGNMTMRRVAPLIAYEDLAKKVPNDGRVTRTGEGIALACLYEGRVFESEGLAGLVAELEQKRDAASAQHDHLTEEHRAVLSDRTVCSRFNFAADYRYNLEKRKNECEKQLQDVEDKLSALEEEKRKLEEKAGKLEQRLKELQAQLQRAGEAVELFAGFIEKEKDYQNCRGRLSAVRKEIEDLAAQQKQLAESRENLRQEIGAIERQVWQKEKEQQDAPTRYILYKDAAPAAETVEGSVEELEERLRALKEKFSGDLKQLEKRKKDLEQDCARMQRELAKLGLKEEEYAGLVYDEQAGEKIAGEIVSLEVSLEERRQEEMAAVANEAAAKEALKNALQEIKRIGVEAPLPPEEIRGDFGERRRRARRRGRELEEANKKISEQIRGYERIREEIGRLIDPGATEPEKDFVPERDAAAQAAGLARDFDKTRSKNKEAADRLRNSYAGLRIDYKDKNLNIDNIFKGLDPLWDKAVLEYESFYFLYERMSQHCEKLAELIRLYESQLANLERNKKDLVQQSFLHGLRFYEEIQWISDNSRIRLQGRSRQVQMLKIELQLDNQDAARQRMREYIEECILKVREMTRQEKREDAAGKTAARLMSSRELLNVFLGNPHIPVSVFKIDLNMQNSRLKRWEDAVRENSGGEKFVVFFSVLSALMTYTRARAMEAAGGDAGTDTRVLVMDNPFGPISSEHLLNPLFEIARKHRTQLICLSDLKQNSIMNCFNLIYMLKVRSSVIGSNEYLKFEEIIRDFNAVQDDEKLEKAVFRASDVKQISLFEEVM